MTIPSLGNGLARMGEGMGIALDSVRANKARAVLTILGVAIGVMVVIAMASMITGINRGVMKELESLGPKSFFVQRFFRGGLQIDDGSDELSPWRRNPWITVQEAELLRTLPTVRDVAWREEASGPVSYGDAKVSSAAVIGFNAAWTNVGNGTVTAGRSFTEAEYRAGARAVVINDRLAEQIMPGIDPLGKRIKIYGEPFTVIGIYAEPNSLFSGASRQPILIIPHSVFTKVADYWKGWMMVIVMPRDEATIQEAQDQVIAAIRGVRGLKPAQENNFAVVGQDRIMETFNKVTSGFFLVMLALSSVGLMVGGVGVIAIMMISVTERTREIGVRKALGATRSEVMFQFLVEAATLTLMGGLAGMALGAGIAWLVNNFTPIPAAVPLWSVVVAIAASIITGVFFGLYPASKASKLDPVEALRYE
jgi:putative ABC transport system permease protein